MKNLVTLYIGTFDKDTLKQELSINYFKQELDKTFNCYTLTKCYGRYKHQDGTTINELTLKVEYVDYDNTLDIKKTCTRLKHLFNQECIIVTTQELDVEYM